MRLLLVLRGIPGSGKSTFIKENELEPYTLCPDDYRIRMGSLQYNEEGKLTISQKNDRNVWKQLHCDLENRMKDGITTVIDATHTKESYFSEYNKLCEKYRYRMIILQFNTDLETCKKYNLQRAEYKQVPEEILNRMYEQLQNPLSSKFQKMTKNVEEYDFNNHQDAFKSNNLDDYESVVIVGDIHGCYTALIDGLKKAKVIIGEENNKFMINNKIFVIFIGDYIDRGIENDKVVEFMYSIMDLPNVKLLEGNHESHLLKLSRENAWDKPYSVIGYAPETCKTICSLTNEQKKKLSQIAHKCGLFFLFNFDNKRYQVTHSALPTSLTIDFTAEDILRGIDKQTIYQNVQKIDETFTNKVNKIKQLLGKHFKEIYSIHGHANPDTYNIKIHNTEYTFNLCDNVEKGGNLRILKITKGE